MNKYFASKIDKNAIKYSTFKTLDKYLILCYNKYRELSMAIICCTHFHIIVAEMNCFVELLQLGWFFYLWRITADVYNRTGLIE